MATRLLFVDDEAGIRKTLELILEKHGFEVTTSATVREALQLINHQTFDVLISDLNIGQPGDGFTVVSAMRRVQPEAATFILTGYPDFDTALQAIRNQVDDYLLKPTDIPTLIQTIMDRLQNRRPTALERPLKRVSQLMRESMEEICGQWLKLVNAHAELMTIHLLDRDRVDHIPQMVEEMARRVDLSEEETTQMEKEAAKSHGRERARQGYTIPLIVIEMRLLQRILSHVLQRNLIRMDLSTVTADMMIVGESLQEQTEYSIRGYQQAAREVA
jgi:YesN/AraC family two-component response regulator